MLKKIFLAIVLIMVVLIAWNYDLVTYALKQAQGQLHIVWNARPVEDYLSDPEVSDTVKLKLKYIQKVRKYAIEELGLNNTDNYTTMYDQHGKPVLWVVTGCKPFAFEAKEWDFPVVGKMPYKGFFIEDDARETMNALQKEGYDAGIRTVGGWSTLGWFRDPILSNMLYRSKGELANLIIHEMVHATIFVKDSVDFNENLASFIADQGTYKFFEDSYGLDSDYYNNYVDEMRDDKNFVKHILRGGDELASLYQSFQDEIPTEKLSSKEKLIEHIMVSIDTISFHDKDYVRNLKGYQPNNTYFMSFLRYRSKQDALKDLYEKKFNKNLTRFINYLKLKHPFL